jgi:hypothetical protein
MHANDCHQVTDEKCRIPGISCSKLPDNALAQPVFSYKAIKR